MLRKNLDKLKSTFIKTVGYDLHTPLNIIHGYAEMLQTGQLGTLSPEQQRAVEIIARRANKMVQLVERFRLIFMVGAQKSNQSLVYLDHIVFDILEKYQAKAIQFGITLAADTAAELPPVLGSAALLTEAIDGLVDNAVKFTPRGGEVVVKANVEEEWVCLTVSDTGIGIAEEELNYLFDTSLSQVDDSSMRGFEGIGLGLTVVKAVVQSHAGQIKVTSQANQGCDFMLKFPVSSSQVDLDQSRPNRLKLQRILIVDDEENITLTLQLGLRKIHNCEVITTNSGEQALEYVEHEPFDLLITDYKMPDVNGLDLAAYVRQKYPDTPVILITAYRNDELIEQAERMYIQHILDKPVELKRVRHMVTEILEKSIRSSRFL